MSQRTDHLIGITPIVIRRAAYYLQLGEGTYRPEHPHFDEVRVRTLYEVSQNQDHPEEWSQGMVVSFFQAGRRVRWVEFGCRVTGAGGDAILTQVPKPTEVCNE